MDQLNFDRHYGGKIFMDQFSTVRLHDPERFVVGFHKQINLKRVEMGVAKIVAVRTFFFRQIRDPLAYLDCGKNASQMAAMLQNIYGQAHRLDRDTKLDHVVLQYTSRHIQNMEAALADFWREKIEQQPYNSQIQTTLWDQ